MEIKKKKKNSLFSKFCLKTGYLYAENWN
jgi:hypothetical protein